MAIHLMCAAPISRYQHAGEHSRVSSDRVCTSQWRRIRSDTVRRQGARRIRGPGAAMPDACCRQERWLRVWGLVSFILGSSNASLHQLTLHRLKFPAGFWQWFMFLPCGRGKPVPYRTTTRLGDNELGLGFRAMD